MLRQARVPLPLALRPQYALKPLICQTGEAPGDILLLIRQYVDSKRLANRKQRELGILQIDTNQNQSWFQRDRTERIHRQPMWTPIRAPRGDHRNSRRKAPANATEKGRIHGLVNWL